MNKANTEALRRDCQHYEAALRNADMLAPHAVAAARTRLVESIRRECVGHTHLFGRALVMPKGETLVELTQWIIRRAERGELPDPTAIPTR